MLVWIILALVVALVLWVRFAQNDSARWHVDPAVVTKTAKPNQFLMRDGGDAPAEMFDLPPEQLAAAFHEVAVAQPRVTVLAEDASDFWITYEQRSKLMGYPDFISVRITPVAGGKSAVQIYSRSRFGKSDLGVNKARVTHWLGLLRAAVAG